ncbi:MAG: O-antigen ligase family protein [Mediterraneibacter gnavus]
MKIHVNTMATQVLMVVIFLTNITQMPQLIRFGANSLITLVGWGCAVVYILGSNKICINKLNFKAAIYALFFFIIAISLQVITKENYVNTSLSYPFMLSVFVFLVGSLYANKLEFINISSLYISYIVSGLIVAGAVYLDSFAAGYNWMSRGYAYASKNSVAQIILTVFILLAFTKVSKKIWLIVRIVLMTALVLLLAMLKSRASIVGLMVIVLFILFNNQIKRKYKVLTIVIVTIFIWVVCTNQQLYEIVVNGIILAGRSATNLNDISSGRYDMIGEFWNMFIQQPLIGYGSYYLESFPLSVLVQYGIFGSIPILLFICLPFRILKKIHGIETRKIVIILLICYYINGLFEELAPLGPGVKCYFLWFLLGLETKERELLRKV